MALMSSRHPFAATGLFALALVGLMAVTAVNPAVAIILATAAGTTLMVAYYRHGSAMYVSLDCADGHHAACAGCWCDTCPHDGTHAVHAIAVTEANR